MTRLIIPFLRDDCSLHPALSWFVGGYMVFVPLFVTAILLVKREQGGAGFSRLLERLRVKRFTGSDWRWFAGSALLILVLTGVVMMGSKVLSNTLGIHELETTPGFMKFQALQGAERLYLLVWLPMFLFNIVGEEILWRGYILPRQELAHGKKAWMVNGFLWMVFHLSFGIDMIIMLLPSFIILPYTAQKRENTLIGIASHALLNGPSFVLIALGIMG